MDTASLEMERAECFICRSDKYVVSLFRAKDYVNHLPGTFYLSKCSRCGLVFQSPRIQEKDISLFYPDSMEYLNTKEPQLSPLWKSIEKNILINYYGYTRLGKKNLIIKFSLLPFYIHAYRQRSIPMYTEKGRLLEIGCSTGVRLKKLNDLGWETKGVELSPKAAADARTIRGLDVDAGFIHTFNFPAGSFDVIILDMVLEHIYNPDVVLKKITSWLKGGGQLIFSIPYFEGFEFGIFKEYSYGLQLPNHITFFNRNALRHLLKKDYKDIRYAHHSFDRDFIGSAQNAYQETGKNLYKILGYNRAIRLLIVKPLVAVLSILRSTSRVTVFAKKRSVSR